MQLRFVWLRGGTKERTPQRYMARVNLDLAAPLEGKVTPLKRDKSDRTLHRVLLLWLKGALNAVQAGIVSPEAIFLPFLEGADGVTVAEAALPRLPALLSNAAEKLLALPASARDD